MELTGPAEKWFCRVSRKLTLLLSWDLLWKLTVLGGDHPFPACKAGALLTATLLWNAVGLHALFIWAKKIHRGLCWLIIADLQILPCRNMMRCKSVTQSPVAEWQSDLGQANVGNLSLIIVCPVVGASLASQSSDLACRQDRYIPWPSGPAKFAGWHLKPRVSKQNPRFFFFHKFQDHAPKCSDFVNAVGPQKVLHFCPVYWSSTPKHKPKHNKNILYFHQFQGVPTHVLYHRCTRVNHGLNMGWTRVRENLVIFKIHEV